MKILLLCPLLLVVLQSCATKEIQKTKPAFSPPISTRELNYIILSVDNFLNDGKPCDKSLSKAYILKKGGLRDRSILLGLPDGSSLQLKITSDKHVLLSGYTAVSGNWLEMKLPDNRNYVDKNYQVFVSYPGLDTSSEFEVSRSGGRVADGPVLELEQFQL
jgi:hypothetical protein